jgi:hypothetical protein
MTSSNIPGIGPAIEGRVAGIDAEFLTSVVRAAVKDETAAVGEWNLTPIRGGGGGGYFGTVLFPTGGTAKTASGGRE